ncbi:MAG: hypothetical protein HRT45_07340 [Bdellovibrionales bacterium]|nr:hypothetical protein [Bdellovibrionales bacterium]
MKTFISLLLITTFSHLTYAAEDNEQNLIKAKDLKVLPIAPQQSDGFDGKVQTSFSPPPIRNFSAEMLKKATSKKKPSKVKPTKKSKSTKAEVKGKKFSKMPAKKKSTKPAKPKGKKK